LCCWLLVDMSSFRRDLVVPYVSADRTLVLSCTARSQMFLEATSSNDMTAAFLETEPLGRVIHTHSPFRLWFWLEIEAYSRRI
jgi:hypothetical protein